MDALRTTRRFRGAIAVAALFALIFLVGPQAPASSSQASDGTRIRFAPSQPSSQPAPTPGLPATYPYHELQSGVWGVGATTAQLPLLQVVKVPTDSGAPSSVVLDAAVRDRQARLKAVAGAPADVTRRTVFGGYPGAMIAASDGRVMRTQVLAVRGRTLYVATVLHVPGDAAAVTGLLDALRFDR